MREDIEHRSPPDEGGPDRGGADRAERRSAEEQDAEALRRRCAELERLLEARTRELRVQEKRLTAVLESTNTTLWDWSPVTRQIYLSPTYSTMLGWAPGELVVDQETWPNHVHPDDLPATYEALRRAAFAPEGSVFSHEFRMRDKQGKWRWVLTRCETVERGEEEGAPARRVVGVHADITGRKRAETQERLRSDVLEKLARGEELPAVLEAIVRGVEAAQPEAIASIMLVDDEGRLRMGAAPSLPAGYCAAIEGLAIGEGVGSCGTAAMRGERIVAEDLQQHPCWASYRELVAEAGLAACWSEPVFDAQGKVLATFGIYYRAPGAPAEHEVAAIVHAAHLASIAIERHREEQRLKMAMLAMEASADSIFWQDMEGHILYVNPAAERALGYSAEELLRMRVSDIDPYVPPEVWGEEGELILKLKAGGLRKLVSAHRHREGHLIPIEVDSDAFLFNGRRYSMAICRDISERLAAEQALRKSEAKFSVMFSLTPAPMALTRLSDSALLEVSRSFGEYFGVRPEKVTGRCTAPRDLGMWIRPEDRSAWQNLLEAAGEVAGFETVLRRGDGREAVVLLSSKVIDLDGERCVLTSCHDITEKKEHERQLELIAHHDALTRLPNRLLLGDRLRQAIAQNERAGTCVAVCYLDIDGFKTVNDSFGHAAGDRLLVEVAKRLASAVRGGDTVSRLGGDEFVLLLSGLRCDEEFYVALDRLVKTVAAPYTIDGREHSGISASIGVTLFPHDRVDPDTLVRHADHAMYAAKQAGKNRYQLFDTQLERRIEARHASLKRIEEALAAGEFRLYYQPKVDCRQGRVVGAEALIRWQHPTRGLLPPGEFLPQVEDEPLAVAIGDWVIRESLDQLSRWRGEGLEVSVSVNAFARQLLEAGFVRGLAAMLAERPDVRPDQLWVEIVETAALQNLESIRRVVEQCRALGVRFALDDFGTGYSSLAYLRHLPAHEIKVDQSFVRDMLTDVEDRAIVEAVVGLARVFRCSVVAEGAETPGHIAHLLELGCDVMQGYALARPMPPEAFAEWAMSFRPDPAWRHRAQEWSPLA